MDIHEQVEKVILTKVKPMIRDHGGELEIESIKDGIVYVRLLGACSECPSAQFSTKALIKQSLMSEIPEIKDVEIDSSVSPELLAFARNILNGTVKV